jgi:hypothetical protein
MAVDMLVVVTTTVSTAKPAAWFGVDFYGGESMQKIEKVLARQQLVCGRVAGESLQWLLRLQGVRSKSKLS